MLTEKNIALLKDEKKKNNTSIEFDPKKSKKRLKITIKGKDSFVSIDDLYNVMLAVIDLDKKTEMIQASLIPMIEFKRKVTLMAEKDIKKGETIVTYVPINVPKVIVENELAKIKEPIKESIKTVKKFVKKSKK